MTQEEVLEALKSVIDPDLHRDIVSLGFVEAVEVEGERIKVRIKLTTPACPVREQLKAEAEAAIRARFPEARVELAMEARVREDRRLAVSLPGVKTVLAVGAGKGGVGKSTVAVNLAAALCGSGARVGILDADVYGPNVPLLMGGGDKPRQEGERLVPAMAHGMPYMSMAFFIEAGTAMVWRGPMIHSALRQLLSQTEWGELDYLVVDMPPGTGDAQLSLSELVPVAGAVVVTTPQAVSIADAVRGVDAFGKLGIRVLGIVENMAGEVFGSGGGEKTALGLGVPFLGRIPLDAAVARSGEAGLPLAIEGVGPAAEAFQAIAGAVAARLSTLAFERAAEEAAEAPAEGVAEAGPSMAVPVGAGASSEPPGFAAAP